MGYYNLVSSSMFSVQNESPFCVITVDMFAMPLTTFKLPAYAAELANLLVEALSLPPSRT